LKSIEKQNRVLNM